VAKILTWEPTKQAASMAMQLFYSPHSSRQ